MYKSHILDAFKTGKCFKIVTLILLTNIICKFLFSSTNFNCFYFFYSQFQKRLLATNYHSNAESHVMEHPGPKLEFWWYPKTKSKYHPFYCIYEYESHYNNSWCLWETKNNWSSSNVQTDKTVYIWTKDDRTHEQHAFIFQFYKSQYKSWCVRGFLL